MARTALTLLLPVALAFVAGTSASETHLEEALGSLIFNQMGLLQMVEAQGNATTDISQRLQQLENVFVGYLHHNSTFFDDISALRSNLENLTVTISSRDRNRENVTRSEEQIDVLRREQENLIEERNALEKENIQTLSDAQRVKEDKLQLEEELSQLRRLETETQRELEGLRKASLQLEEEKEQLKRENEHLEEINRTQTVCTQTKGVEDLAMKVITAEAENSRLYDGIRRYIRPRDCDDHYCRGEEDGIYEVFLSNEGVGVPVHCDMRLEAGGWTTFLRRQQQTPQEDFARPWAQYKEGFGDPSAEHWMGLETLHALTESSSAKLRLEAMSFDGTQRWAEWDTFSVGNESSGYKLTIGHYDNNSSMGDPLTLNRNINRISFSTIDRDSDTTDRDCVGDYSRGGGWWYASCSDIKPTAPLTSSGRLDTLMTMFWSKESWQWVSLKEVKFMFRHKERSNVCLALGTD